MAHAPDLMLVAASWAGTGTKVLIPGRRFGGTFATGGGEDR